MMQFFVSGTHFVCAEVVGYDESRNGNVYLLVPSPLGSLRQAQRTILPSPPINFGESTRAILVSTHANWRGVSFTVWTVLFDPGSNQYRA